MRVLFTTAWYPNRKVAGDGVFVRKHAQAVALLHDVAVLMVQTDVNVRGYKIEMEVTDREVLVYVPKISFEVPVLTGLLRLFWLMSGYLKGYHFIKKHFWQGQRPEICHVNVLTRAAVLPWLLKQIYHIPYLITEHWSRYLREGAFPSGRLHLWLTRKLVHDADYVCPVSLNLEQAMKQWGLTNKHYTRIGNVVSPLPELRPATASSVNPLSGRQARFVHVSWMRDDTKNISGILRTLAKLAEERQDWHMDFIGEGNDKESLMAYAEELGLYESHHVSFLPAQESTQLMQTLPHYDALVMFSNTENQPVSVLEALAVGLPVVATRVGDVPKMLAHNRGIVIDTADEQQLLDVLSAFVSLCGVQRQDAALRQQRHQYVAEHHGALVISRQFDVLYQSMQISHA